jgi:hypothetical protein
VPDVSQCSNGFDCVIIQHNMADPGAEGRDEFEREGTTSGNTRTFSRDARTIKFHRSMGKWTLVGETRAAI